MEVDAEIIYTGDITVGDSSTGVGQQTHSVISYDTRSTQCIIPGSDVSNGWFDETGYDIDTSNSYTYSLGTWTGSCYNFTTRVCVDNGSTYDERCVSNLDTCLLYNPTGGPSENSGVLGLGKPYSVLQVDQTNSFAQQNYLRNLYEPIVTFSYHFEEDNTLLSEVSFGDLVLDESLLLGNVSSYEDTNGVVGMADWALKVSSASWGLLPTDATFDNDVAILASASKFIALPSAFYTEVEAVFKLNDF